MKKLTKTPLYYYYDEKNKQEREYEKNKYLNSRMLGNL